MAEGVTRTLAFFVPGTVAHLYQLPVDGSEIEALADFLRLPC